MKAATKPTAKPNLATLEPIIDQLLSGVADAKEVAERLCDLGQPIVLDPTEQLRLALRLLECHDDSVGTPKKRSKPPRLPEADLA
jgi:hypothetical protein